MRIRTIAEHLSLLSQARKTCATQGNDEWFQRHTETITRIEREYLPSGSGVDNGTKLDTELSTHDKLVFRVSFHHMNEHGMYDGWTDHIVRVRPTFGGVSVTVSGPNRNEIHEYLSDLFHENMVTKVGL